jgi:hypothetical protein
MLLDEFAGLSDKQIIKSHFLRVVETNGWNG